MSKVSVVMAAYNVEQFIGEAIQSVINQTYEDWELQIGDDASTDSTPEVAFGFINGHNINIHMGSKNMRQAHRRNDLILKAQGEYIAILDADDYAFPTRLAKQVEFLDSHPDVFCVGSGIAFINKDGKDIRKAKTYPIDHDAIVRSYKKGLNPIPHSTTMYRKIDFIDLGGYNETFKIAEDYALWITAIVMGKKLASIPEVLVKYRENPTSVVHRHTTRQRKQEKAMGLNSLKTGESIPSYSCIMGNIKK